MGLCNYDHRGPYRTRTRSSIGGYRVLCWYLNTMLLVAVIVGLANFSFVVVATLTVVVVVLVLHSAVLLIHICFLGPDLVVGIGLVGTVAFIVGTDVVAVVAETDFVSIYVVLEDYTNVVSDRLEMVLGVCSDHSRYSLVACRRLLDQVKNMPPWIVVENTLIGSMEPDLVVRELEFDVVVQPLGVLGMLYALKLW